MIHPQLYPSNLSFDILLNCCWSGWINLTGKIVFKARFLGWNQKSLKAHGNPVYLPLTPHLIHHSPWHRISLHGRRYLLFMYHFGLCQGWYSNNRLYQYLSLCRVFLILCLWGCGSFRCWNESFRRVAQRNRINTPHTLRIHVHAPIPMLSKLNGVCRKYILLATPINIRL